MTGASVGHRRLEVDDDGERLVVHLDRLGGVLRLGPGLGHDHGHAVALVTGPCPCQRPVHRDLDVLGDRPHEGQGPPHSPSRSAAVNTADTPGMAAAAAVSMPLIRAWAYGLRTTSIQTMPGSGHVVHEPAVPGEELGVLLAQDRGSDEAFGDLAIRTPPRRGPGLHRLGRGQDGLHDVLVAGAPAEVALEADADGGLVERAFALPDQAVGGHDHARGAVPALQAVVLVERLLERVHPVLAGHALDGGDLAAVRLDGEHRAGLHRPPVHQDGARAARRGVAPDVRSGEPEVLPQEVHEQRAWLDVPLAGIPVHRQGHVSQGSLLSTAQGPRTGAVYPRARGPAKRTFRTFRGWGTSGTQTR